MPSISSGMRSVQCIQQSVKIGFSAKEKAYAHYVGQASWYGARIILAQQAPHMEKLYDLIIALFTTPDGKTADLESLKASSSVSTEDWEDVLQYTTQARARHLALFTTF